MRVHVVCRNAYNSNRILPRLARTLAEGTGWTIGDVPDPTADLNYYSVYLEAINNDFRETPTAAWFTHRDTYQRGKAPLWDKAAAIVNLRLTSDRRNLKNLSEYGPTELVARVPLDQQKFKPDPKYIPADMPVVGTSGWVYPGGRKGEGLVRQLVSSEFGKSLHFVASGDGWPVQCKKWPWHELEKFYQNLDVYLCTSLLEGVCYGPLEALACGKPVVIPQGVGILDDLPEMTGIYTYSPGDYGSMCSALRDAIDGEHEPTALRMTTEPYTAQAWIDDHRQAFENFLDPPRPVEVLPDWRGKAGVFYVAFGKPSRSVAVQAIRSFQRWISQVPVGLVSDKPLNAGEDIFIKQPDRDIGGRIAKIKMYELAPADWQYVLYLDADTEIVADISVMFQFLADGWELVICKNPAKYHVLSEMVRPDNRDESDYTFQQLGSDQVLQLNGGVLAFRRNERTEQFFRLWYEEWNRWGKRDQGALHRALWRCPLRTYVLGNEWNTITRYDLPDITAGILHHPITARRWSGRIDGRLDSKEAWAAVKVGTPV